jgi:hypothetical protein
MILTPNDYGALRVFFETTVGRSWKQIRGWDNDQATEWLGVTVQEEKRKSESRTPKFGVKRLTLDANGLQGVLCQDLVSLKSLTFCSLRRNSIAGPLPDKIDRLKHLRLLDLAHNCLEGNLPEEICKLSLLELLDLSFNNLHGPIPPSFSGMKKLKTLNIRNNKLDGALPPGLFFAPVLESLIANENLLESSIPPEIGNCTSLKTFYIPQNQLTGKLPQQIASCFSLQHVDLSSNQLSGPLLELAEDNQLIYIDLSSNMFSGPLPSNWRHLRVPTASALDGAEMNSDPGVPSVKGVPSSSAVKTVVGVSVGGVPSAVKTVVRLQENPELKVPAGVDLSDAESIVEHIAQRELKKQIDQHRRRQGKGAKGRARQHSSEGSKVSQKRGGEAAGASSRVHHGDISTERPTEGSARAPGESGCDIS